MTLSKNAKRTTGRTGQTGRTTRPHRTGTTRRVVHRQSHASARSALITVDDALLTEARDWTVLAGASLAGWLMAAIAIGAV